MDQRRTNEAAVGTSPGRTTTGAGVSPPGAPRLQGYTILGELGRGGMGVVYKARNERLKRVVALKLVRPDAGDPDRVHIEAEAVARLHHPNVVQIYEVGEQFGLTYLALEYVDGGTLKALLDDGPPLTPREAAGLIEQLAEGVHAGHLRDIVHRDLKPANVLLTAGGVPKITDFGLAKRLDEAAGATRRGEVLGTPAYMSPEQARGDTEAVGPAADVYALGAILYECLTGWPPFRGQTVYQVLQQVLADTPMSPRRYGRHVPPALEAICLKCLAKDPAARYATARELADDLRRFLNDEPVRARPAGLLARAWGWAVRNPIATTLLGSLLVALAFGLIDLVRLPDRLVQEIATQSADQQAGTMHEIRNLYAEVRHGFEKDHQALPIPFQFMMLLGDRGRRPGDVEDGGLTAADAPRVLIYSDHPFSDRRISRPRPLGPPHEFGREALAHYRQSKEPFPSRLERQADGTRILRHATPIVMKRECVACHNETARELGLGKRWEEGEVRGVLEIVRPVEADFRKTGATLRGIYLRVAGVAGSLLALGGLVVWVGNKRRR